MQVTESKGIQEALAWLFSFLNTEDHHRPSLADFYLPRTEALLTTLGSPQQAYPSIIVAGTNGKGSTSAMLEAILRAKGLKVGLYTSPALHCLREQIQVNRRLIPETDFASLVNLIKPKVAQLMAHEGPFSTYEITTALALLYFAKMEVDYAVLEIGLGGRCDAVNVVSPVLSVLTSISRDHTNLLGTTLAAIAREKAGIIKPHIPAVTTVQAAEVMEVLLQKAEENATSLYVVDEQGLHNSLTGEFQPFPFPLRSEQIALAGTFQLENAQLAVGASLLLQNQRLAISIEAMREGLAKVRWPLRLERLYSQPLVLADGAHNEGGAKALRASLEIYFPIERLFLILGFSGDKDLPTLMQILLPIAQVVILTRSPHPRACPLEQLEAAALPYVQGSLLSADTVAAALAQALDLASPTDVICVTGSLFTAAAAATFFAAKTFDSTKFPENSA